MMALTTQLWTINALATELGISSRVLGRRLSDLRPDQVEQQEGRQVKRWRLARVLKHLKAASGNGSQRGVNGKTVETIECHKHVVAQYMFPALLGSRYFLGFFLAHLHEDIGLTKVQALRAYGAACIALHYALGEFYAGVGAEVGGIEDDELEVRIPPELRKLCDLGPEAYAEKYWSR
jgi:hypothetical protein